MSLLPRVLLVDESADDRDLVELVLAGAFGEVEVVEVGDAAALARAIGTGQFGLMLCEHELAFIRSTDLLRLIRDLRPECPVVVVTSAPIERAAAALLPFAPDGLVPKTSAGLAGLPQAIRSALFHAARRGTEGAADRPARRLLDALPGGVFVADRDGTLLDANPALAKMLGRDRPEACVRRPFAALFADRAEGDAFWTRLVAGGAAATIEARLRRADGGTFWAGLTAWRSTAETDGGARIEGLVVDRSGDRAATAELARRGAELERTRREADEMAYVVSHDLRKPITQVARFLELLAGAAADGLDAEARDLLDQARQSAGRLEGMVEAVLRCARVEGRGEPFADVALDPVLDRVLERLADELAASGAEIVRAPLPTLPADAAQLEQLLHNLLDNALKFRGAAPARIEITAADEGEAWHLAVRDQGIGLDAKDAERIFVMFQRLHTAAEIPGSGIGLAVCRRIVARHGGRIWVESRPGAGATFHFTLAKKRPGGTGERPEDER